MKKLCFSLLLFAVVLLSWGVTAIHVGPEDYSAGKDLELLLEIIEGTADLAGVNIEYRNIGDKTWLSDAMHQDTPHSPYWRGSIPSSVIAGSEMEYRFELKLLSGNTKYLPDTDSLLPNFLVNPFAPQGTRSDGFVLLSDESSISADDGYVLAVSFLALATDLVPRSIKIYVDGRDVTKRAEISNSVLMYREEYPAEGIKKALITGTANGQKLYSDTWITQVLPGTAIRSVPFTLRGSANISTNIYAVSGDNPNLHAAENDYRSWTDLYGTYGIFDLEANLLISSLEDSNRQPVNRYTFGLKVPNFDLFLGDYAPNLSKYTLSGKNIRGLYARVYGRYAALSLSHGQSVRQTQLKGEDYRSGTFQQEAMAGRFRLGSEKGFMVGFNASRHRDVISSLDEEYYRYQDAQGDTLYTVTARDNLVLSMDAVFTVPHEHVTMGLEVAGSLYNSNTIPGSITAAELQEYGLKPVFAGIELSPSDYSDFFVINKNMEPFLPSEANLAWIAYLRMYYWNNFLNFEYSQTGSSFHALGAYSQPADSRMFTFTDQLSLGRMLTLSGGYTLTEDNLMKYKSETNTYHNLNAQAVLRIPKLPYLKTSFYTNTGKNSENSALTDSSYVFSPFNRDSLNMTVGLGYHFLTIPYVPTQLDLSFRFGNDFSEQDMGEAFVPLTDNKNSGINLSMSNRYTMIPLRTQFSFASSKNQNTVLDAEYASSSVFFKADYSLWSNKIKPYVSFRTTGLSKDYAAQNYNNYNLGVESYPLRDLSVSADLGIRSYANDDDSALDYSSTSFRLSLTQRF